MAFIIASLARERIDSQGLTCGDWVFFVRMMWPILLIAAVASRTVA